MEKSRIRETKHLSTDADSSTDTTVGRKTEKSSKTQKLKNVQKYAKICNIPINQRSLIHWEAWFPGGLRIPQNLNCLKNRKKTSKSKYTKITDTPFNQRSLIHQEAWSPPCFVRQNKPFFLVILDHLQTKIFKSETTTFISFYPRIPDL